jgi:hypothetical protein
MEDRKAGSGPIIEETPFSAPKKPRAELGRDIQAKIGQQLRAMYDDVVEQGVPDRFTKLLNQLDTGEHTGKR